MDSADPNGSKKPAPQVDREKITPFLIRVFWKKDGHNRPEDYNNGNTPKEEMQIYTWRDATLRELCELIKDVNPETQKRNVSLSFSFVYPDKKGRFTVKHIATVPAFRRKGHADEEKSLAELGFQAGDFIDLSILER